ncbi:MAG: monovalent cation/H(+) antiporter subunit G [Planctomycetota bacterium]|jgi:multicomponent Na+:H+ antiporter subunit G
MPEAFFYWFVGIGLAFDVFGCIGLVRLPDVYNRAQAATKCVTLGTCMILIGTAGLGFAEGIFPMGAKALVCTAFVLLTSPVAAHAICRGAYISGVPLWEGSVEDGFSQRAKDIRDERDELSDQQAVEEAEESEKAETS